MFNKKCTYLSFQAYRHHKPHFFSSKVKYSLFNMATTCIGLLRLKIFVNPTASENITVTEWYASGKTWPVLINFRATVCGSSWKTRLSVRFLSCSSSAVFFWSLAENACILLVTFLTRMATMGTSTSAIMSSKICKVRSCSRLSLLFWVSYDQSRKRDYSNWREIYFPRNRFYTYTCACLLTFWPIYVFSGNVTSSCEIRLTYTNLVSIDICNRGFAWVREWIQKCIWFWQLVNLIHVCMFWHQL